MPSRKPMSPERKAAISVKIKGWTITIPASSDTKGMNITLERLGLRLCRLARLTELDAPVIILAREKTMLMEDVGHLQRALGIWQASAAGEFRELIGDGKESRSQPIIRRDDNMAIQNKEARFLQERRDFERHFPHAIGRWDDRLNNGHGGYSGIFDAYWMGWAVCVAWRDGKKSRSQPNG